MIRAIQCLLLVLFLSFNSLSARSESAGALSGPGKTSSPASTKSLIGHLKNPDIVEGCGCYFQTPAEEKKKNSKKFVFMSGLDDSSPTYMNIDGQDLKLTLQGAPSRLPDKVKKGFRYTRNYSTGAIKAKVDFVVTWLCPPKDESCEVTNYDATVTVEKGEQKQTLLLKGGCGC